MAFSRWWILFAMGMAALTTPRALANPPSTQPAPAEWGQIVNLVARGLSGDAEGVSALPMIVTAEVSIRNFGSAEPSNRTRMQQQTEGLTAISVRLYSWPALNIATDLSADLRSFEGFPESLRKQFIPRDDSDIKKANTVAQLWINRVLNPGPAQLVGIIVLWEPPPPVTTTSLLLGTGDLSETKQPYFILIKGIKTGEGEYHITQIVCGDANQALN